MSISLFSPGIEESCTFWRHVNGGAACIDERPRASLACLSIRIGGGSGADPSGKSGLAHLFEHLLFTGTARIGRDMYMAAVADEGAQCQARTGASWMNFFTLCSSHVVHKILELEVERFSGTISYLDESVLEREKRVVCNERSQRVDSAPYGDALEHLLGVLYGDTLLSRIPVGINEEIRSITLDDCVRYFTQRYAGEHINIAVSGDLAAADIREPMLELLNAFPPAGPSEGSDFVPPSPNDPVRFLDTELPPKIYLGYLLPSAADAAFDEARLGAYFLGKGENAYLRRKLVGAPDAVMTDVRIKTLTRLGTSSAGVIEAVPLNGIPVSDARARLRCVLDGVANVPFAAEELVRAKAEYSRSWHREDDTTRGRADGLSLALLRSGRPSRYFDELKPTARTGPDFIAQILSWWDSSQIVGEVVYR